MTHPPTVPTPPLGRGIAQRVAEAAAAFQHQATGHAPASVSVVLNGETVVITLRGALTPAEMALSQTSAGASGGTAGTPHGTDCSLHRIVVPNRGNSCTRYLASVPGARLLPRPTAQPGISVSLARLRAWLTH